MGYYCCHYHKYHSHGVILNHGGRSSGDRAVLRATSIIGSSVFSWYYWTARCSNCKYNNRIIIILLLFIKDLAAINIESVNWCMITNRGS